MLYVYMYSIYKDLGSRPGTSREHMQRITAIQMVRDAALWEKLTVKKVPSFPMDWTTFMTWRSAFDELTMSDPLLCLLFVVKHENKERKCLLLANGNIASYSSREEAYKAIYSIQEPDVVATHAKVVFYDLKV